MYRPRTVYRGKERSGRAVTLIVSILVILLLLAAFLFYDLQKYMVYDKDGARLVLPAERAETAALSVSDDGSAGAAAPVEAEIVIEKPDWSGVVTDAGRGLSRMHARFVAAADLTGTLLGSFVTGGIGTYDALVLELKPATGRLAYKSAVPLADSFAVNGSLDLRDYAAQLKEKGVYLAAQLSALPDTAMAVRNAPVALKGAGGVVYTEDGRAWLDPYADATRAYLSALMAELAGLGFDEIILDGLYLPEDGYAFSVAMTAAPDAESAVGSLALYLRSEADALGLKVSVVAEKDTNGQDLSLFFKVFDRVAYADGAELAAAVETAFGGTSPTRFVPIGMGYVPDADSYIVK